MIRQSIADQGLGPRRFRWRGHNVSRLENLTDVVFAFAFGSLLAASGVPSDYAGLVHTLRQIPSIACSFAVLVMCWFFHYWHHRRYGLEDAVTTWLNFLLLFVVLFYAYPLRLVFDALFGVFYTGQFGRALAADGTVRVLLTGGQYHTVMLFYTGGFALIFGLFAAMGAQAWRCRETLELTTTEAVDTRMIVEGHLLTTSFAVVAWICLWCWPVAARVVGPAFALLGPLHWLHGRRSRRLHALALPSEPA